MPGLQTLLTGLAFGESPRWHDGRLWFSNWGTHEIVAFDGQSSSEVVLRVPTTLPYSIDWLPDGRLLVVSGREGLLLGREPGGGLTTCADLNRAAAGTWNEIVVDGRANVYVNGARQAPPGQGFGPGLIVLVAPDGTVRQVADDLAFPNGMAVTADNTTLIVAESHGQRLTAFDIESDGGLSGRRVWASLGQRYPDGICIDADGAVWYADVPNKMCVRVREGGEVLQTIALDRGCFACMLGGRDGSTLFMLAAEWRGFDRMFDGARTGQLLSATAPAPHAGHP